MRKYLLLLLPIVIFSCSTGSDAPQGPVFEEAGFAIGGYDPVAYFEQSEAKLGNENETAEYGGYTYCFASTKNRELFEGNPEKYLPAYGGWCAYAVAETATKMQPDPTKWQIQDGQLQLFTSNLMTRLTGDLREDWNEDPEDYKSRADSNWTDIE